MSLDLYNRSLNAVLSNGNLTVVGALPGPTVGVAVDIGNKLIWFRNGFSTLWNNSSAANPATGTGGISFTPSSGIFPMASLDVAASGDITVAGAFAAASMQFAIPSGFSAWDTLAGSATTWNPSDKNASVTLSGGNLTATSSATGSYVGVRATNSLSSGKGYFEFSWNNFYAVAGSAFSIVGIGTSSASLSSYVGSTAAYSIGVHDNGTIYGGTGAGQGSFTANTASWATALGTVSQTSGKWYFEVTLNADPTGSANSHAGVAWAGTPYGGETPGATAYGYTFNIGHGQLFYNNSAIDTGDLTAVGGTIGIAIDIGAQLLWVYSPTSSRWNGSSTANPATGTGGWSIASLSTPLFPALSPYALSSSSELTANFGATSFAYSVPSGFTGWEVTYNCGAFAWTEPADTVAVTGTDAVGGAFAWTEPADAFAFAGTDAGHASFAWTEPADIVAVAGVVGDDATFVWTEPADTFAFAAYVAPAPTFPTLLLGWPVNRRPTWRTIIAKHVSGAEQRTALYSAPLWEFEITIDGLSASASEFPGVGASSLQALMGFFLNAQGQSGRFLFTDPDFNEITGSAIGTGDGTTAAFTFMRSIGGFVEPVSFVTGTPTVYLNGVAQSLSSWALVQPNGLVFNTAPAEGAAITADFSYQFLCRFLDDTADFEQQMVNLWELTTLKFRQVRSAAAL